MSELATRVKQTLAALRDVFKSPTVPENMTLEEGTKFCDESYSAIIEQALLAERRLAMEEAYQAVFSQQEHCKECADSNILYASIIRLEQLRAAAEKEGKND